MRPYVFKKRWKRWIAFLFDGFFGFCFSFLKNHPTSSSSIKKILLSRIDHLGDALLLRPALVNLRAAQPEFEIHVLTTPENAPVFQHDPFIDRIIPFPGHWFQKEKSLFEMVRAFFRMISTLRREHYDAAVDFRGDLRINLLMLLAGIPIRIGYGFTGGGWMLTHEQEVDSNAHQVVLNQRILSKWLNPETIPKNTPVNYPVDTVARLNQKISTVIQWPYGVIHMGAGNPLKEWPRENFIKLMENLFSSNVVKLFFLIGTAAEKKEMGPLNENIIDLRGETDLQELCCLLDGAFFFVGNDSGPAHLAAAQGIPVAVLASHTNDIRTWHPWTSKLCILSAPDGQAVSVEKAEVGIISLLTQGGS